MNLPLPEETRLYIAGDNARLFNNSNLGLLFNKYVSAWTADWMTEEKRGKEKINLKTEFLGKLEKESFYIRQSKELIGSVYRRQLRVIQSLSSSNYHAESFNATTDSRLIIGLGSESVIETGMTLHPLYGFPYLPASGLKGLARAYAELGAEASKEELLEIFGSEDKLQHSESNRQGRVFFMDGLPFSFPKLKLDIMNPHYGEYYQGNKPPADYLNPVPVTFLTVAPEQEFSFALFSRDEELAEKAKKWLVSGLTELGAGGKTNVGYGYFRVNGTESCSGVKPVRARVEEDNSLTGRFHRLKLNCNEERFAEFVKSIKVDEMESLNNISFEGMASVNIGLVPALDGLEVSPDVLRIIAGKVLEVIQPKKKWNDAKREKYNKLLSTAGQEMK